MKTTSVVLAGLLLIFCSIATAQDQKIVRIGHSAPLSGPQMMDGRDNDNGLRLAISDLNAKGLVINNQRLKFVLDSQDDKSSAEAGMRVAQQFADSKVVAVFGPFNSSIAIPASRVYSKANIPMLTAAGNPSLTQQGFHNIFRIDTNSNQLIGALSNFAKQTLQAKSAVVIDDRTAYGGPIADLFAKEAGADGIQIDARLHVGANEINYKPLIDTIKDKNPDVVFLGGYAQQGALLAKALRSRGIETNLLLDDAACTMYMAKLAGAAATHVYCAKGNAPLAASEAGRAFLARYKSTYKTDALVDAVRYYDGMMMLADAMQKADSTDPSKVIPQIASGHYDGIAGVYEYDSNGDLKSPSVSLHTFKQGQLVPYQP
ncbi:branched-chain amino acid ABC transporter substrate-binding protein [Burkholderia sp. L27(2015)]|uniref:branched-chain amino acid ABC transporter substrate-binding protein n=1 Tax=Burkholderia sp. L27(2015) TaxID=1641858 RepID=UPI00131EC991|nr:branched-chain amino acid ABC transporter substrate-binding protein [Burkholderia sp. L27(2015)]